MRKQKPDLIVAWPRSPGFQPLAEKATDELAGQADELITDTISDAVIENIVPEPVSMLLEITGTIEQIQQARRVLNAMNLHVSIIKQHEQDDERDDL